MPIGLVFRSPGCKARTLERRRGQHLGRPLASPACAAAPFALLAAATLACGCGSREPAAAEPARVALLAAFPAELAPHLERATVEATLVVDGRVLRLGSLDGTDVVLGLTGIGMHNAGATSRALLDRFQVSAVVVSGVAGSTRLRVGDVAVPATWTDDEGQSFAVHEPWLDRAREIAAPGAVALESCTQVTSRGSDERVCLEEAPAIAVGGLGRSSDSFGDTPLPCRPDGGDVFGCDVALGTAPLPAAAQVREGAPVHTPALVAARAASFGSWLAPGPGRAPLPCAAASPSADAAELAVEDMETAAVAREAAARGVPFIAFRAVSDGLGDPLDLPGFPAQFFAYYRLAARNAAAAAQAFLARLAALPAAPRVVACAPEVLDR